MGLCKEEQASNDNKAPPCASTAAATMQLNSVGSMLLCFWLPLDSGAMDQAHILRHTQSTYSMAAASAGMIEQRACAPAGDADAQAHVKEYLQLLLAAGEAVDHAWRSQIVPPTHQLWMPA